MVMQLLILALTKRHVVCNSIDFWAGIGYSYFKQFSLIRKQVSKCSTSYGWKWSLSQTNRTMDVVTHGCKHKYHDCCSIYITYANRTIQYTRRAVCQENDKTAEIPFHRCESLFPHALNRITPFFHIFLSIIMCSDLKSLLSRITVHVNPPPNPKQPNQKTR